MRRFLYARLSLKNIAKNKNVFLPFLLVSIFMVMTLYLTIHIADIAKAGAFGFGRRTITFLFYMMIPIMCVFMLIVLLYTNSFVMKQRYKELGLYSIMGMQKKNIARLIVLENSLMYVLSLAAGIVFGFLFSKLMVLLIAKMIGVTTNAILQFNQNAALICAGYFLGIFMLSISFNLSRVVFMKPLSIVRSESSAEKEPKANIFLGILGLAVLGSGYYLAQRELSFGYALQAFLPAVLCVIIGTYMVFIAGSILILKMLKKNKRIYYKKGNFLNISTMLYRMKKNAAGLASICVLSTMVLVTFSGTFGLYRGAIHGVKRYLSHDFQLEWSAKDNERNKSPGREEIAQDLRKMFASLDLKETDFLSLDRISDFGTIENGVLSRPTNFSIMPNSIYIYRLQDIAQLFPVKPEPLANGEVYLSEQAKHTGKTLNAYGTDVHVKGFLPIPKNLSGSTREWSLLLIANDATFDQITSNMKSGELQHFLSFELAGNRENKLKLQDTFHEFGREKLDYLSRSVLVKEALLADLISLLGSLLFIGIFMIFLFMVTTAMIIFYKQVSEGREDSRRFILLKKVGLSDDEAKRLILKQVLSVFFLPVIVAIVHNAFSIKIVSFMLKLLGLVDPNSYLIASGISLALYLCFYFVIYYLSAKAYYKMVQQSA